MKLSVALTYSPLMDVLNREIRQNLEAVPQGVFCIKMVKTDRSGYEPHF